MRNVEAEVRAAQDTMIQACARVLSLVTADLPPDAKLAAMEAARKEGERDIRIHFARTIRKVGPRLAHGLRDVQRDAVEAFNTRVAEGIEELRAVYAEEASPWEEALG